MKKKFCTFVVFTAAVGWATAQFVPQPNPNPYADDYTAVSAMDSSKHWGTYNTHDPACFKVGDWFYAYSTDAIYHASREEAMRAWQFPQGNIQVRRSRDLVYWEFLGWALPEIPKEAVEWVRSNNSGRGATNIWAPFPVQYKDKFRLYYCVSAFGKSISYLGLAEANSPEGKWELKGAVVKTDSNSIMNAIDPSVIITEKGEHWLIYGSYFGGLFALQLNAETGLPMHENDSGHLVARRANPKRDNLEAPEVIYSPQFKKYYLFLSYDPLMTTYNIRVGRSDSVGGVFRDFFGRDMREQINAYPILTYPYRFENHAGWAGTGHCGIVEDNGRFFMLHQGRLSPANQMMDLHVREIFWTADGWACVSPERYAGIAQSKIEKHDLAGKWEIIEIGDNRTERELAAGQIVGQGQLLPSEVNTSKMYVFERDGRITGVAAGTWHYQNGNLTLKIGDKTYSKLIAHFGQDWENQRKTLLFTGLTTEGNSLWGKRVE